MSQPNRKDVGVSMAERPLQHEDEDEGALANERIFGEVNAEDPTTRLHEYLESGKNTSEMGLPVDEHWEASSTDDDVDERVGPGEESSHHGRHSPVPSVISMMSDQSMDPPLTFPGGHKDTRIDLDEPDYLSSMSSAYEPSEDSTPVASSSHSQHTTEPGGVPYAVCPKRAFKSCVTCMASFCELHVKQHYTAPTMQRHRLVEATEDLEQRMCSRHHRELELYCRTDQTAICVKCMAVEHIGHDITELGENQLMQTNKSEMENKTAVPPPGPIEFTSVKPDSLCVCWRPPEGLTGPHRFRVSWTGKGSQGNLEVQDLKLHVQDLTPGEKYTFTVATLRDDGRQSPCVSAAVETDIPPPECFTVDMHLPSVSVSWTKPAGVDQASYLLTLCYDGESQSIVTKSLEHRFSELEFEREYNITVSTALKNGQSSSISQTIRTSVPVPENLTVGSVTLTSADLSWSLHQGMEQIPHSFLISYHSEGTEPQTISTESCSTTLTDLQPDTQYTVSVCCELKEGGTSLTTSTLIQSGSLMPEGLSVDALNESDFSWSADISWSLPHGADQSSHRFKVTYHIGKGPNTITKTAFADSCSITLKDLQSDIWYTSSVSTVLQNGRESKSTSIAFHTSATRILVLGKSGEGKSSAGNTILGDKVFTVDASPDSQTVRCETNSRIVNGRKYTITDTPGFFDIDRPEEELIPEIAKCIFDNAPGPHVFIIVMRVGRFTTLEEKVVQKIAELFAKDTFKYALILFTHGRDLNGQTIEEFVDKCSTVHRKVTLKDFVNKCHGRYHVIDNEHWNQDEGPSSNRAQLVNLFATIEDIVQENEGCYSNDISLLVVQAIQREMEWMRKHDGDLTDSDIREKAKSRVERRVLLNRCAATFPALLYAAFSLHKISGSSRYVHRAAATTECPNETVKEACRLLRLLLHEIPE